MSTNIQPSKPGPEDVPQDDTKAGQCLPETHAHKDIKRQHKRCDMGGFDHTLRDVDPQGCPWVQGVEIPGMQLEIAEANHTPTNA